MKDVISTILKDTDRGWIAHTSMGGVTEVPGGTLITHGRIVEAATNILAATPQFSISSLEINLVMCDTSGSCDDTTQPSSTPRQTSKNNISTTKHNCSICREEEKQKPDGLIL